MNHLTLGILNDHDIRVRSSGGGSITMTLLKSAPTSQPNYLRLHTILRSQNSNWMRILYSAGFISWISWIPLKLSYKNLSRLAWCLLNQKSLSLYSLQTDYLNLDNSVRATERASLANSSFSHCGGLPPTENCFRQKINGKGDKKSNQYFNSRYPKINLLKVKIESQIRASDVDQRITGS